MGVTEQGWQPPERYDNTYRLAFGDAEYHGLEVVVRRMSFGAFRATADLTTIDRDKLVAGQLEQVDIGKLNAVLAELGDALVSWNLLDRGKQPVPCTAEDLDRQDLAFGFAVLDAWMVGVKQEQLPAAEPDKAMEAALPMELPS